MKSSSLGGPYFWACVTSKIRLEKYFWQFSLQQTALKNSVIFLQISLNYENYSLIINFSYIGAFCVVSWSSRYSLKRYKNGHLFLVFLLLRVAAEILRSTSWSDVTGTHLAHWLSVPRKSRWGMYIDASEFLKPYVQFDPFWTYIQSLDKCKPSLSVCPAYETFRPITDHSATTY